MCTLPNIKKRLALFSIFSLLTAVSTSLFAETDKEMQERVIKERAMNHEQHAGHAGAAMENSGFRGVFYGYLPCDQNDCNGIKMTLSLNNKNNYLLVTQFANGYSREYFEKGKYEWNEGRREVVLTERNDSTVRRFRIEDEATLIQLGSDGSLPRGDRDDYALRRGDKTNNREVHIH